MPVGVVRAERLDVGWYGAAASAVVPHAHVLMADEGEDAFRGAVGPASAGVVAGRSGDVAHAQ